LVNPPPGCPFNPRCPYVFDKCLEETPPLRSVYLSPTHVSACWLPTDHEGRRRAREELAVRQAAPAVVPGESPAEAS
jgi:hypothetical protein